MEVVAEKLRLYQQTVKFILNYCIERTFGMIGWLGHVATAGNPAANVSLA